MTEEQYEALDRGDLDKQESEADRQKVEADSPFCETSSSWFSAVAAERQQGCKDQDQSEYRRLDKRCRQYEIAQSSSATPPSARRSKSSGSARHLKKSKKYGRS